MLDPTLSPLNLHSIASNHALLTDDRLSEIAAHPMAWPKLVTWANYLLQLPHEDRPSIPVPRPPENFDPSTTPATVTPAAPAEIPQAPLPRTKKNRAPLFILLLALAVAAGVGWTVIPVNPVSPHPRRHLLARRPPRHLPSACRRTILPLLLLALASPARLDRQR